MYVIVCEMLESGVKSECEHANRKCILKPVPACFSINVYFRGFSFLCSTIL